MPIEFIGMIGVRPEGADDAPLRIAGCPDDGIVGRASRGGRPRR